MNWRVLIRATAEADLRDARDWYELQKPGLGDEFLLSILNAMTDLESTPEQPSFYYRDFRRLMPHRFPYKIFYRIEGDTVVVFRILHAARDHTRYLK